MAEVIWAITELQRTGAGTLQENPSGARFVWTGEGHTLPRTGVEIPYQVNTVRTVYPGTEGPVEQVLSTEITPFDIEGEWNDKFNIPGFAREQELAMTGLVSRGALVRMDFEQFSLTGVIVNYTPVLRHRTHIEWRLRFSVHFRDSQESTTRSGQPLPAAARPLRELATDSDETAKAIEDTQLIGDDVILGTDAQAVADTSIAEIRETQDGINERASRGLGDLSQDELQTQMERYVSLERASATASELLFAVRSTDIIGFDSVPQRLFFEQWSRGTRSNARVLIVKSRRAQDEIGLVLQPQSKALVRPAAGSSVYRVAGDFFNAPEGWREIAIANNQSELVFDGKTDITIPVERTV